MKKLLAKILCLVLALSMMLVTGCQSENSDEKDEKKATIEGTWEAEVDFGEFLCEMLAADEGTQEFAEYFELDECVLVLQMTFNDDDTYELAVDKDSAEEAADIIRKAFEDCFNEYFKAYLKEAGVDMTVDEMLAASGSSMEALLDEEMGEDNKEFIEMFSEMEDGGYYKAEDGKLYTYEDEDDYDEDVYETYELDGDTLTVKESVGEEDDEGNEFIYPMEFKRVK